MPVSPVALLVNAVSSLLVQHICLLILCPRLLVLCLHLLVLYLCLLVLCLLLPILCLCSSPAPVATFQYLIWCQSCHPCCSWLPIGGHAGDCDLGPSPLDFVWPASNWLKPQGSFLSSDLSLRWIYACLCFVSPFLIKNRWNVRKWL